MLTEREKQICDRLRRFRENHQIPRTQFALTIGVTSDRLTACELGRAPVRYETFSAVQKHFSINPVWLATGEEAPILEGFSDEKFRDKMSPRELFSSVFERLIDKYLTMDRVNESGNRFILENAAVANDPQAMARLKQAREALGLTRDALSKKFVDRKGNNSVSAKDLEDFESGKRAPLLRQFGWWIKNLGVSEEWLRTGAGKMFAPSPVLKSSSVNQTIDEMRDAIEVLTNKFRNLEKQVLRSE